MGIPMSDFVRALLVFVSPNTAASEQHPWECSQRNEALSALPFSSQTPLLILCSFRIMTAAPCGALKLAFSEVATIKCGAREYAVIATFSDTVQFLILRINSLEDVILIP